MGYNLCGTPGTAEYYGKLGLNLRALNKPTESSVETVTISTNNINHANNHTNGRTDITIDNETEMAVAVRDPDEAITWICEKKIDLVINIPEGTTKKDEVSAGYLIRRAAVEFGASLLTNLK